MLNFDIGRVSIEARRICEGKSYPPRAICVRRAIYVRRWSRN